MKRRTAIKHIGAGLSASLLMPWLSSCNEDKVEPGLGYKGKVAIIGAGAAGLYAADVLLSQGIDVVIFEASSKIGGRIRTLRPFDTIGPGLWFNQNAKLSTDLPVELGSDRVLGTDSIWARYVNQKQFSTVPVGGTEDTRYWFNGQLQDFETAMSDSGFAAAQAFVEQLASFSGEAGTIQQTINSKGIPAYTHAILNGWIGNKKGTDNSQIGTAGVATDLSLLTRNTDEFIVGNNSMADVLIEGFIKASEKTQLNSVIKEIDYSGEKVVLRGQDSSTGELFNTEVDKVIITVPISILKAGEITFTPALPNAKRQAMNNIGMDSAIRVILDFRKNFWGSGFRTIYGGETSPEYFNPGEGRSTVARTLHVTVSGTKAEQLSGLGLAVIPVLIDELDKMYEGQASAFVRTDSLESKYIAAVQDWGKEPYIKGSASYLKPGGTNNDREVLSDPVNDMLFFAGEATDYSGDAGTVNGALLSAERAAQQLITSIA